MATVKSDIEIAREAKMKPILRDRQEALGIPAEDLIPYGHTKAKVSLDFISGLSKKKDGKLILVTAISPTPAGEGKTTTTVGLGDGLNRIGKKAMICLREPSLGPCFGMKGGAAGGGYAQIVPMEDINLHFTGDFHAITSAHNLLSAMIDNHIYWGNELGIDTRRIAWRRVMDMNDRALRDIVCSLGGVANGYPARGRLRHHGRLRDHGDPLPFHLDRGSRTPHRPDRHRPQARQGPGAGQGPQGAGRHDGAAQGCADAQPGADAREQSGLRAWRPLRQYRPWLQFGDGDQGGA